MSVSRIISDDTLSRIIQIESAGKPKAKAPTSSATGLGQFISSTWIDIVKRHRPDLFEGRSQAQVLALRTDPAIAIEMLARFTEENANALGRGYEPGDLYLAHFLGTAAAKKLLRAAPDTPVSSLVSTAAINANRSILSGKTAGQVRAWAAGRMAASGKTNWVERYIGSTPMPRATTLSPVPIATDAAVVQTAPVPTPATEKRSWWSLFWKRDPAPPVAAPEHPPGMSENGDIVVYKVQKALAELGYAEVGMTDGLRGPKLDAAIRAFRVENGLPGSTDIDDALLAGLHKAPKRQLSKDRVTATAQDLRAQGSQQIKLMDHVGGLAKFLGIGSVVGAIDQTGALDSAMQTVNSVRDTAETITRLVVGLLSAVQWCVQHWWVFGIGIAVVVIYKVTMSVLNVVIAFRQGILQRVKT